jgi:hypothetical protein
LLPDAWADHLVLQNGDMLTGTVTAGVHCRRDHRHGVRGPRHVKRASIASLTSSQFSLDARLRAGAFVARVDQRRLGRQSRECRNSHHLDLRTATRLGPVRPLGLFGSYLFLQRRQRERRGHYGEGRAWRHAATTTT